MFIENVLERDELMKLRALRRSAKLSAPGLTIIMLYVGVVSNLVLSSLEVPLQFKCLIHYFSLSITTEIKIRVFEVIPLKVNVVGCLHGLSCLKRIAPSRKI